MNTVYFVIPCYNEEEVIEETCRRLTEEINSLISEGNIGEKSRMLFVDDGSRDSTWNHISNLCISNPFVCGLKLSRNKGHQNALLAGLMTAKNYADCAISLDADLQDDIGVISQFIDHYKDGCDIVYGVRSSRQKDKFFKRTSAQGFYKLMRGMGVEVVDNHADYRLMSRRALEALADFSEVNLFLRGIVPLIGFKSGIVYYERQERFAGQSKYPLKKMISFAMDGITSFSVVPLKIISILGLSVFFASFIFLLYALFVKLFGRTQAGWATIIGSVWLIGGLQLLSIGVCGEYIGKIYKETKRRPRYIIENKIVK